MKSALVTGAKGFLGNQLCKSLIVSGYKVKKHVRKLDPLDKSQQFECDLEKNPLPDHCMENVDVVFHLAGLAHDLNSSSLNSERYYSVNVDATVKIAELAARKNVKNFIFVSSVKAGGNSNNKDCSDEETQNEPIGIYAKTKREAEIKLIDISQKTGMKVTIVRSALVYGPKVKGNLEIMINGIKRGWFPPIPDNSNMRSMIHIDDIVAALEFVAHNKNANNFIYIATDGMPHSSRELYISICNALGIRVPNWSLPIFFFKAISLISPSIKRKVHKILGNDCYSSKSIESIGFKAKKSLKDINETDI
jgi:nucleoside-diphosphate-sugar epimerase